MSDAAAVDGRRLRRQVNREAVLDALLALWEDGRYSATSHEVAARAGISARSLFRYFEDVDDLSRAAIERMLTLATPLFEIDAAPNDPVAVKIERAVEARLRLYDVIEPGARAGRATAARQPLVAAQLHATRMQFRNQLRRLFAAELAVRPDVLPAVDVLLSFESRDLLRAEQGMSRNRAATALVTALTALLAPDGGTP